MTRNEFMKAIEAKRKALVVRKENLEQELIDALAQRIEHASIDQEENLVIKIKMAETPLRGLSALEIKQFMTTLPWVVSADWSRKDFLYMIVREIPSENYLSAIKPVIGFHE